MSQPSNCYDNAQHKSFWRRLKTELLDGGSSPGLDKARLELARYSAYNNNERCHSAFGYYSPNCFDTHLQTISPKCPA
ncbi:integrase core domain-containing protein [Hymenobacter sp. BT635]|uniref:Integrase core domain-containing protein n=1 Tax=Hymenobacter nitidus TaxID=2880929 RepID=A0ABS8AJ53_9BACT|nr:integrase core domain-containing protein [Hymenobacter nitidus]